MNKLQEIKDITAAIELHLLEHSQLPTAREIQKRLAASQLHVPKTAAVNAHIALMHHILTAFRERGGGMMRAREVITHSHHLAAVQEFLLQSLMRISKKDMQFALKHLKTAEKKATPRDTTATLQAEIEAFIQKMASPEIRMIVFTGSERSRISTIIHACEGKGAKKLVEFFQKNPELRERIRKAHQNYAIRALDAYKRHSRSGNAIFSKPTPPKTKPKRRPRH